MQIKNAKRMAKDASSFAHQYELIADKKCGKVYGASIYLATNKYLIYDISRQMKQLMAICSNDVRSYYGRIVHVAASLDL